MDLVTWSSTAYLHASNASSASPAITAQYYLAELASPDDLEILVTQQDFQMSLAGLVPSVSQSEMKHYNKIQNHFSSKNLEG
jgi:peroxin-6